MFVERENIISGPWNLVFLEPLETRFKCLTVIILAKIRY